MAICFFSKVFRHVNALAPCCSHSHSAGTYKIQGNFAWTRELGYFSGVVQVSAKNQDSQKWVSNNKSLNTQTDSKSKQTEAGLCKLKASPLCNISPALADPRNLSKQVSVLVFDLETTGFSRKNDRIIEFAIQDLSGGRNSTFATLVNPGMRVQNTFVHGIRDSMVNQPNVPRWEELVPILLSYVKSRQKPGGPVLWIAHNGRTFDVPFLVNGFRRCCVEIPSDWLFLDTLILARHLVKPDGSKLSPLKLESLSEYYKIPQPTQSHRAMSDVQTLSLVLQKLTFDFKITIYDLLQRSFKASDLDISYPETEK